MYLTSKAGHLEILEKGKEQAFAETHKKAISKNTKTLPSISISQ